MTALTSANAAEGVFTAVKTPMNFGADDTFTAVKMTEGRNDDSVFTAVKTRTAARWVALTLTLACIAGAFLVSFHALTNLAASHGVPPELAWVWAAVVDVTVLGGTVAHMALPEDRSAVCVLAGAAAVSVAGNAAYAAQFGLVGIAIATFPPVAMLALVHLSVRLTLAPAVSAMRQAREPVSAFDRPAWLAHGDAPNELADGWRRTAAAERAV